MTAMAESSGDGLEEALSIAECPQILENGLPEGDEQKHLGQIEVSLPLGRLVFLQKLQKHCSLNEYAFLRPKWWALITGPVLHSCYCAFARDVSHVHMQINQLSC